MPFFIFYYVLMCIAFISQSVVAMLHVTMFCQLSVEGIMLQKKSTYGYKYSNLNPNLTHGLLCS